MAFRDLFSKDGRELIKSKIEYEQCENLRQNQLLAFRKTAAEEITFKYPDARLLLNRLDRHFMVLIKNQGKLLVGSFADDYFPRLDYVTDQATAEERVAAVSRFRDDIRKSCGPISWQQKPQFENSFREKGSFATKGYALTGEAELEYLVGGALFLDGHRIAIASIWDPKPRGYFSTIILEKLIQGVQRGAESQLLTFVTVDCNPIMYGQKMNYQIFFNRSVHAFDEGNRKEFVSQLIDLRDFLYDMEEFFRLDCPLCDPERLDYTPYSYRDDLATADFVRDESIETRYPY